MKIKDLWTVVLCKSNEPVVPIDDNPESDDQGMIVYRSQRAAELAAEYQAEMYGIDCRACRMDKAEM
ncbi:MAG: hypothetical protein ABFD92_21595 [Planctomycetaceae bacterium]